jgi:hypothetical protein
MGKLGSTAEDIAMDQGRAETGTSYRRSLALIDIMGMMAWVRCGLDKVKTDAP